MVPIATSNYCAVIGLSKLSEEEDALRGRSGPVRGPADVESQGWMTRMTAVTLEFQGPMDTQPTNTVLWVV